MNTEKLDETDRVVEIEQLAALEPLEYEIAREAAAKRLKGGRPLLISSHSASAVSSASTSKTTTPAKGAP